MIKKLKESVKRNRNLYAAILFLFEKIKGKDKSKEFYNNLFSNVLRGSLVVKVKNLPGIYNIDARSHILRRVLIDKDYEPEIVDSILKNIQPDKDAINIGANIGFYTNLMANNINNRKKVLAIEPTPNAFEFLKSNIELNNNEQKVILFNGVATNKPGDYKINVIEGKEEYSSIGDLIHFAINEQPYTTIKIKGETIDNLVEKFNLNPSLLVIDVEGAENLVLTGAIETLKKYRPVIIAELDDNLLSKQNTSSINVIKLLKSLNYNVIDTNNALPSYPFIGNIIANYKNCNDE